MMSSELTLRLWLVPGWQKPHDSSLSPKQESQTGRHYFEFRGNDAFAVAKLVPQEFIDLVTVRQQIQDYQINKESIYLQLGVYLHGSAKVVYEIYEMQSRIIYVTGKDIEQTEEAYNLFRQGKLRNEAWNKVEVQQ